jgi:hypothetical protein
MQIKIETKGCSDEIEELTVSAFGDESKALLAKLLPHPDPMKVNVPEEPSKCSLREAAALLNEMGKSLISQEKMAELWRLSGLLTLLADGRQKLMTIKAIREVSGMGLKEAKILVERVGPFRKELT